MLGQKQGMPRWEDDPVWRRYMRCQRTDQEVVSSLEVSLTTIWADMGDRNNNYATISNRA